MAGSTLSLESLSSPSPSPSPPPNQQMSHNSSNIHTGAPTAPTAAPFRTIDTDSELSELTDDDQDASTAADKRATSTTTPSSSKGAGMTAIDDDDDDPPTADNNSLAGSSHKHSGMRGIPRYPNSSRRGGGGRKKRSSIVPAPMWGWVPEKTAANAAAVEEEEEEMSGPPRAMEEEEEEEDEEEEEEEEEEGDDYDVYDNGNESGGEEAHNRRGFTTQRRQGPYPAKRIPASQPHSSKTRGTVARQSAGAVKRNPRKQDDDYEDEEMDHDTPKVEKRSRQLVPPKRVPTKHENGDDRPIANGGDDEGSVSGGSEYLSNKRKKAPRSRPATSSSRKRKESENEESGSDVPVSARRKNGVKIPVSDHDEEDAGSASNEEDNTDSDAEEPKPDPPAQPLSPLKLTNSKPLSAISPNPGNSATSALSALAALANAVDPTSPPSREVVSINATAASSSIMAGATSSVEVLASGTTSGAGTRHVSRSRSNSAAAKSDAEASAEESKIAKRPTKGGKPATRGGKSRTRGKPPVVDKKHSLVATNGDAEKATAPTKKGPPAPLDLKIDTSIPNTVATGDQDMDVDEELNDHVEDADVDMDPSERDNAEDDDDGEDEVDNDSVHEEDDDPEHGEEVTEVDHDVDEEAIEADDDAPDHDGEDDQEQEQENDQDAAEVEQENEEGDEADNDDEHASPDADVDVDVEDHESDLQPAHRAEALDVLATIELKFALLRERVYVEKMEALAWEEMLVQNAAHPEFQHLQKELLKRRDKRLELASRKRSYEIANAETRRNADESNIWSWWKFTRDELQTEMIAETSRKRRKLERERRAMERPQPIRRIPHPSDVLQPPMAPPSLRKIIKSYPFGSRKQNKSDTHHHHHSHSHYPKNLVYPEISTLSANDIQSDLDYLFQYRRTTAYDQQQHQQHHQPHYPLQLQRNGSGMGGLGMGRSTSMVPNGPPPPPIPIAQSNMGPPPPGSIMHQHPPQHSMGYESYGDIPHTFNPIGAPGRVREQYGPQGAGGSLPGVPLPPGSSRDNSYSNFAGPSNRPHQHAGQMPMGSSQHHGYPSEHEMSTMVPGPNNSGIGHQIHPNHPYFGQGSMTPGNGANSHGPLPPSGHISNHHSSNMKGGMSMNDRRSMSPGHGLPNGNINSKTNGNWIDPGMGSANFHGRSSGGKGGDWDPRMMHEEEERERVIRERKRDEREKEKEHHGREMERARREREYEHESRHEHQHIQQMSHRPPLPQGPSSSHSGLSHMHSNGNVPPSSQGSGNAPHLHNHYHHRGHHHHVVHHHHPQQPQGPQHAASTMPLPGVGGGAPIIHSPRSTREYEGGRSQGPIHAGPGQPHPTELIMLSSNKRDASVHWPNKNVDESPHHLSTVDYRDRDRGEGVNRERSERDRDLRKIHSGRHSTGPAMPLDDRGDRPMAMPFVMASSHTMQQTTAGMPSGSHMNGSGLSSSTSSPRGPPSWNGPGALEDPSYRTSSSAPPPSGYLGSPRDAHVRSPVQGHRYASSSGSHAPPLGRGGSTSSSAMHPRMASPPPPSGRARPPPSPSYTTTAHHSPAISPKVRALSPVPVNSSAKHILSGPMPGPGYSSPHLSGPGLASGSTGHQPSLSSSGPSGSIQDVIMKNGNLPYVGSRTASPLMSSLQGSGRAPVNGGNADRDRIDRDRERPSPRLGAPSVPLAQSKFGAPQMVDGH